MSRILITDDSMVQRLTLSAIVKAEGHEVVTANNGREAIESIKAQVPDCMLLDILMPEMDGVQVLEALEAENIQVTVIMISADVQKCVRSRCLELGAKDFLNKPIQQDALCAALKKYLSPQLEGVTCN